HTRFSRDWSSDVCSSDLSLRKDFGVDAWALLHFTERQLEQPLVVIRSGEMQRTLHRLFKGHRALCGQLAKDDIARLLGTSSTEARSVAAAQIRGQSHSGILTVASNAPGYYRSSMDTLFLDYIADVLALRLAQIPVS